MNVERKVIHFFNFKIKNKNKKIDIYFITITYLLLNWLVSKRYMDCYDLYVHELLMKTNMKLQGNFKEKKNIVNKISCLIKKIRAKSYWFYCFIDTILIQDDEYLGAGADNREYFSVINFDNIVDEVNKKYNIELLPLYNIEDISFDNLEKSYLLLLKLYKKEIGKLYRLLYKHEVKINTIESDICYEYEYNSEPDPFTNGAECFDLELKYSYEFIKEDTMYQYYMTKIRKFSYYD